MKEPAPALPRLVLDTHSFIYAQESEIAALARTGFRISVSVIAMGESWARALRENAMRGHFARAGKMARYIDTSEPIAFVGPALFTQIGAVGTAPQIRSHDPEFRRRYVENGWMPLVSGTLDEAKWREYGASLEAELSDGAAERFAGMDILVRALRLTLESKPNIDRVGFLMGKIVSRFSAEISMPYGLQERLHGFWRYTMWMQAYSALSIPGQALGRDPNDAEDARFLHHLAWPSVLVTGDHRFVERLDKVGTFQRGWVRTIGELLTQPPPEGPPWGKSARRVSGNLPVRTREGLSDLQKRVREQLTQRVEDQPVLADLRGNA